MMPAISVAASNSPSVSVVAGRMAAGYPRGVRRTGVGGTAATPSDSGVTVS